MAIFSRPVRNYAIAATLGLSLALSPLSSSASQTSYSALAETNQATTASYMSASNTASEANEDTKTEKTYRWKKKCTVVKHTNGPNKGKPAILPSGKTKKRCIQVRVEIIQPPHKPWTKDAAIKPLSEDPPWEPTPPPPPDPAVLSEPQNLTGAPGNLQVSLAWDAPASDGGSDIIDYIIQYRTSVNGTWTTFDDGVSTTRTATVTSLINGTSYDFHVAAVNADTTGPYSKVVMSTPRTTPSAPQDLSATPGNQEVLLTWDAPSSDGGANLLGYRVYQSTSGVDGPWTQATSTVTGRTIVLGSLTNGTAYWFQVKAVNNAGEGPAVTTPSSVTPLPAPTSPRDLTTAAGNQQITVSWAAPSNPGASPVTGYSLSYGTSADGPWSQVATGISTLSRTVTGLSNGTAYWFRVTASNNEGESAPAITTSGTAPRTIPGAPSDLTATPGNTQVSLSWSPPESNGGNAISDYIVQYKLASSGQWRTFNDGASAATTATVTGLTNGSRYDFQVAAVNDAGSGSYSASASTTPRTVPAEPTNLSGAPGNQEVALSWSAPNDNGGATITGYVVAVSTSVSGPWTQVATDVTSTNYTVTSLDNGTPYWFQVAAINAAGSGTPGVIGSSVTPRTTPTAPINPTGTPGNTEVALSWVAPADDGGAAVTGYTVYSATSSGGPWQEVATEIQGLEYTITGLTNGTAYWFQVAASNEAGEGAAAITTESSTPRTVPLAPSNLNTTASNAEVGLTWDAPSFDGGAAIENYIVYFAQDAQGPWTTYASDVTGTSAAVTGLTNGAPYWFRVAASNEAGEGAPVETGNSTTPRTVPNAPLNVAGTPDSEEVVLTWGEPGFDGGAAIDDYTVYYSTSSEGPWTQAATGVTTLSYTVTGLTNGTPYWFQVAANNEAGEGAPASAGPITPRTVPDAPLNLSAQPSDQEVALSWDEPAFDGGNAVSNYIVQYRTSAGGEWGTFARPTSTALNATVTGLVNATSYDFQVAAVNEAGSSVYSTPVTAIPALPPSEPLNLAAQFGDEEVALSWDAPSSDGGSAIEDYTVRYRENPEGDWQLFSDGTSTALNTTVTGLSNGTTYDFQVAAVNPVATGPYSAEASATPATTPSAPLNLQETADDGEVSLTWGTPTDNGGAAIEGYTVYYATSAEGPWTEYASGGTNTDENVTGLVNGTPYWFRVSASNIAGAGEPVISAQSVTPRTVPDAPLNAAGTPDNEEVVLAWDEPGFDGGAAIDDYTVYYSTSAEGPWTQAATGVTTLSYTVTGLTNGTAYWFQVAANNEAGEGAAAALGPITPRTVPTEPLNLAGVPDNQEVALTWDIPASDGGAAIDDYTVYYSTSAEGPWTQAATGVTTLSYTVTGLTNGTAYWFQVAANNEAGEGAAATTTESVTPRTVPTAPLNLTATPNDTEITLTWDEPADNGGATINDYIIEYRVSPAGEWITISDGESTTRSVTITGLINGTAYDFQVAAVNIAGTGPWTTPVTQTPCTISDPPTDLNAQVASGSTSASLSWTAPAYNGGADVTYTVSYSTSADGPWTVFATDVTETSTTVTDLAGITSATPYWFTVEAVNPAGASAPDSVGAAGFSYGGALQGFTVPTGVTSLSVTASGAAGGGGSNTVPGGGNSGSRVSASLAVTAGATLYIAVGGGGIGNFTCGGSGSDQYGARDGGWPGGGNSGAPTWFYFPGCISTGGSGGGYSGIFSANSISQANALLIAGGGGGRGVGGGNSGANGTTTGGGARGTTNGSGNNDNTNGSALTGGRGESNAYAANTYPGGGGGGGYFGGGGGAAGGAGGNGASWTGATASDVTITNGVQAGNGFISISWTP